MNPKSAPFTSYIILTPLLLLSLGACDSKDGNGVGFGTDSSEYNYTFSYNNCETGKHTFSSLTQLCDGLKDDSLNHGCAESMREDYFKAKGCAGSFSPAAQIPPSTSNPPVSNQPSTPSNPSTPALDPAEQLAKETFLKNYASGLKTWTVKNADVKIVSKDKNNEIIRTQNFKCSTATPIKLEGKYPELVFQLGWLKCDTSENIPEVLFLNMIGSRLSYGTKHLPVSDIAPNQFRLLLKGTDLYSLGSEFHWSDVQSINANSKENSVYLDFMGRQSLPGMDMDPGTVYFMEAVVTKNALDKPVLRLSLSADLTRRRESSELTMTVE